MNQSPCAAFSTAVSFHLPSNNASHCCSPRRNVVPIRKPTHHIQRNACKALNHYIIQLSQTSSGKSPVDSSTTDGSRPNIKKYKSQRSVISGEKGSVTAKEVNDLMVKAGKEARDLEKWKKALKGSFAIVSARLVATGALVGFARATSDHALNGTIWDVVTDPELPDEILMKRNVIKYLLKELRRTVPGCSIALFSDEDNRSLFEGLDFVADPDGIRGMALFDQSQPHYL